MRKPYFHGLLLAVLLFGIGQVLQAQNGSVAGTIFDENEEAMAFAHVLLLQQQDSVLVKGVASNGQGGFILEDISVDNYIVNISLLGSEAYFKVIQIRDSQEISMGIIRLAAQNQNLQAVEEWLEEKLGSNKTKIACVL